MRRACAIVSYRPPPDLLERVRSYARILDLVVVVDNDPTGLLPLRPDLIRIPGVVLIENPENLGQATAMNQAIRLAVDRGCAWTLALDQDTPADETFIRRMLLALEGYDDPATLAVLAPVYFDDSQCDLRFDGRRHKYGSYSYASSAPLSGNLLSHAVFGKVGGFRDDFFIDWVDHEYCFRCRARGFDVVVTHDAVLTHRIGFPRARGFAGYRRVTSSYSPLRKYYNARNRVRTILAYRRQFPGLGRRETRRFLNTIKKTFLVEPDRARGLAMILRGVLDGFRGLMGRFPGSAR